MLIVLRRCNPLRAAGALGKSSKYVLAWTPQTGFFLREVEPGLDNGADQALKILQDEDIQALVDTVRPLNRPGDCPSNLSSSSLCLLFPSFPSPPTSHTLTLSVLPIPLPYPYVHSHSIPPPPPPPPSTSARRLRIVVGSCLAHTHAASVGLAGADGPGQFCEPRQPLGVLRSPGKQHGLQRRGLERYPGL